MENAQFVRHAIFSSFPVALRILLRGRNRVALTGEPNPYFLLYAPNVLQERNQQTVLGYTWKS